MKRRERPAARLRQLDLLPYVAEEPPPQLPESALRQVRQLLQKLLLELIDAVRAGQEGVDE